jgi:hypothetical protein
MDESTQILLIVIILGMATLLYINYACDQPQSNIQTFMGVNEVSANNLAPVMIPDAQMGRVNNSIDDTIFANPQDQNINPLRNSLFPEVSVLDKLMQQVDTGNDFLVNSPSAVNFRNKSNSINSRQEGQPFKKISYRDSQYRQDFGNDAESQLSKDELNNIYADSLVFKNDEYATNNLFTGYADDGSQNWGNADITGFGTNAPQTQQQKITDLYNANAYLPNANLTSPKLTEGFQILNNPVAVSSPDLIPVLKSIPVSSTLGSTINMTYDIRAEPPCPKTVVSPFLNSSIMPDIYSTQRGCLA